MRLARAATPCGEQWRSKPRKEGAARWRRWLLSRRVGARRLGPRRPGARRPGARSPCRVHGTPQRLAPVAMRSQAHAGVFVLVRLSMLRCSELASVFRVLSPRCKAGADRGVSSATLRGAARVRVECGSNVVSRTWHCSEVRTESARCLRLPGFCLDFQKVLRAERSFVSFSAIVSYGVYEKTWDSCVV